MPCEMIIPLTDGMVTVIDESDWPILGAYSWNLMKCQRAFYARASKTHDGKRSILYMHRVIMGLGEGDKRRVDHKDGDGLNNRRENLRVCTHAENLRNQHRKQKTKSGFKGVWPSHRGRENPWVAIYTKNYKRYHIGVFKTAEDAARAYDDAVTKAFGEFASLNFPKEVSSV